jgi:tripeptide aminopeptidase
MNRLINTFLEIVQIDSITGHEENMVKYIYQKLNNLGIKTVKDSFGNIIGKIEGKGEPILLTAHLDTVDPGRGIKPKILNGVIKSSGDTILGCDNKVAVAIILEALETIVESKINRSIEVVFTLSEEVGNYGAVNLDYSLIKSKLGFSFDSEGEIGTVITASPFYNRFDIKIIGKSAHASQPENGINSLVVLKNVLNKITLGKIDKDTIANIGVLYGGSVRNTILGELEVNGEVRSFVEDKIVWSTDNITNTFKEESKKLGATVICDVVRENPGFKFDKNEKIITEAVRVLEQLNIKPVFKESYGCYDGNIFIGHGIKVLNLCDGSKHSHTVNEQISVDNLNLISKVLINIIMVK